MRPAREIELTRLLSLGLISRNYFAEEVERLFNQVPKRIAPKNRTTIRRQLDHILEVTG